MALKSGVGGGGGGGLMGKTPLYSGSYSSSSSSPSCVVFGLNTSSSSSSCCNYCWIGNQQQQLNRCSFFSSRINVNPPPPPPPLIITGGRGRTLSHTTNTSPSPPPDYLPNANFYKVEAILRPWRIPQVSSALLKMGIRGVTVSDVRGFGAQGGLTERQAGSEFSEDKFLAKVKMEIVVSKDQVEAVIDKIIEVARTGEIGDGKIFLVPVTDVIRVRTGERGEKAERMVGGRSDMFSGA